MSERGATTCDTLNEILDGLIPFIDLEGRFWVDILMATSTIRMVLMIKLVTNTIKLMRDGIGLDGLQCGYMTDQHLCRFVFDRERRSHKQ